MENLLFISHSQYGKGETDWRLGKITAVKGMKVSATYSVRGAKAKIHHGHFAKKHERCFYPVLGRRSNGKYKRALLCHERIG